MKHYKNPVSGEVFGYDPADEGITHFMYRNAGLDVPGIATFEQAEIAILEAGWVKLIEWPLPKTSEQLTESVLEQRAALLQASDKYALVDVWARLEREQQVAWSAYRQALRDVTEQPGFPVDVTWPVTPGAA